MTSDARQLLSRTPLVVRPGPFVLGAWRHDQAAAVYAGVRRAERQTTYVVSDEKEVTALLLQSHLSELPHPERTQEGWALLTLDLTMAWDVVGVLALLTGELADAGIPVGAASAFSRDHLLVPGERLDAALEVLGGLFASVDVRTGHP